MLKKENCVLYSGGAVGAEAEVGGQAESYGLEEVNLTYEGRGVARSRGVRGLSPAAGPGRDRPRDSPAAARSSPRARSRGPPGGGGSSPSCATSRSSSSTRG